jgi:hypothetical protein
MFGQMVTGQFSNYGQSDGHRPIALHQLVVVPPSGDQLVPLRGYDADGDKLKATVKSLPGGTGTVHQLSKVFSDYGYEPKKGVTIMNGQDVTGSKGNRIYYKRPSIDQTQVGHWGVMKYTVSDLSDTNIVKSESYEGMVTFIPPNGIIVGSHFTRRHEDWKVIGNKGNPNTGYHVNYEASSRGSLNHYVYASDDTINTDQNGNDINLWYFLAPSKFLGHYGISYDGTIEFTLSSFHGDFSKNKLNNGNSNAGGLSLVEIYCSQCNINKGNTIVFPLLKTKQKTFNGKTTKYSIKLNENSGWLLDPKNTLSKWYKPTQCQFIEILSGISSIKILGDFTKWYESVALDDVSIINLKSKLPLCAQLTPDASTCTCSPDAYSNTVILN